MHLSSTDVVPSICLLLHDAFQASSCQIICLQAAKATVFNGNFVYDVASTVATEPELPDFIEEGFYNDFQNAGLLLRRHGGL